MMSFSRLIAIALCASCVATLLSAGAIAKPLDKEACKNLNAERQSLQTKEITAALARGPDWVKEHLHSADEIEKVRQFLLVEEKIKFRCRTDGVVMPKPKPIEMPDRKPPVPVTQVAEEEQSKVLAEAASTSLLPLRKPSLSSQDPADESAQATADAEPAQEAANAEEVATSIEPDPGPSQTVADSDKTAPPKDKATQ